MKRLLYCDFKRVLKDKLFLVLCIVGAVFALTTPLMYAAIFKGMGLDAMMGVEEGSTADLYAMLGIAIDAKTMFFSSFSLGNNFGLVAPVLLSIVLCKDFSYGTIRNKIISGNSRITVFLSMFIVCFCVLFGVMFCGALISMLVGLCFFPFSVSGFSGEILGYFFASLGLEAVLFLFLASLVTFLCTRAKNAGVAVVLYAAIVMVMTLVGSILTMGELVLTLDPAKEGLLKLVEFIEKINVFGYSTVIGVGESYDLETALFCAVTPFVGAAGLAALGAFAFKRKDIK